MDLALTVCQEQGLLRGKKEYIELSTQKSGSIFTTMTLRELSDKYFKLQEEYNEKQKHLVAQVVSIAGKSSCKRMRRLTRLTRLISDLHCNL